jgi:septum formation protein
MFLADKLKHYRIILASRSPRRKELLSELGLTFEVRIAEFDESYPADLKGEEIAAYIASAKSTGFRSNIQSDELIITADTIVWCNGKVLGKPRNERDAELILNEISGNTHEVITGVCILTGEKSICFTESTKVTFSKLSNEEISYYISKYRPYDKAGAYGIQEWIGVAACRRIEGSYFNVVGLPVQRLYEELNNFAS